MIPMKEIVCIYRNGMPENSNDVDAWLIPVEGFSTRSSFEMNLRSIRDFKKKTSKKIYLLCDALLHQKDLELLKSSFADWMASGEMIFFQDLSIFMMAKQYGIEEKMVFYTPTLNVSFQDICTLRESGIQNFILSKECAYQDYKEILKCADNLRLGMLALGFPQIYFSARKMISCFDEIYHLNLKEKKDLRIKEKTRTIRQPIYEDERGTYIFAGEIFFPYRHLKEFFKDGMYFFIIDPVFIEDRYEDLPHLVSEAIETGTSDLSFFSQPVGDDFLFREMVDDYDKKD